MTKSLDAMISEVEDSARDDEPDALTRATGLVAAFPAEPRVWSLRAYIQAKCGNLFEAIRDESQAMALSDPEPCHYFDRGRYRLKLGDNSGAITDFGHGVELCDQYRDDYYRESLYFVRAEAFLKVGRKQEALADLAHVRDGFTLWTTELRSKENLLLECG